MNALELRGVTVEHGLGGGPFARLGGGPGGTLRAVDQVDLAISAGTTLGLVGESGSGKSTLARAVVGLVELSAGEILISGEAAVRPRPRALQRRTQMVFQDPGGSLNPALTVRQALSEPIRAHELAPNGGLEGRCRELVAMVELPSSVLELYPRQLSGGQRQRVAIARALALEPELLIADEVVSALDVSVQAAVLRLLRRLQRELGVTMLFISHDLAVVRQVCSRIAVMYLGSIVEQGPSDAVLGEPQHPYTAALLAAAPRLGRFGRATEQRLVGEQPSPLAIPPGCRFHPRCPIAVPELCAVDEPDAKIRDGHAAACHFAWVNDRSDQERVRFTDRPRK